ncbi:hypothetical protein BC826DRAFT_968340 [Russula brevipes]|nr:hypothetical protein BC826DRAFT_968340 [Russula brevipes]
MDEDEKLVSTFARHTRCMIVLQRGELVVASIGQRAAVGPSTQPRKWGENPVRWGSPWHSDMHGRPRCGNVCITDLYQMASTPLHKTVAAAPTVPDLYESNAVTGKGHAQHNPAMLRYVLSRAGTGGGWSQLAAKLLGLRDDISMHWTGMPASRWVIVQRLPPRTSRYRYHTAKGVDVIQDQRGEGREGGASGREDDTQSTSNAITRSIYAVGFRTGQVVERVADACADTCATATAIQQSLAIVGMWDDVLVVHHRPVAWKEKTRERDGSLPMSRDRCVRLIRIRMAQTIIDRTACS